jgi:hypothetical protein
VIITARGPRGIETHLSFSGRILCLEYTVKLNMGHYSSCRVLSRSKSSTDFQAEI